ACPHVGPGPRGRFGPGRPARRGSLADGDVVAARAVHRPGAAGPGVRRAGAARRRPVVEAAGARVLADVEQRRAGDLAGAPAAVVARALVVGDLVAGGVAAAALAERGRLGEDVAGQAGDRGGGQDQGPDREASHRALLTTSN